MSMLGWGLGDIIAISQLAVKVRTAYKDAPDNYRHISEEVKSLQTMIDKAVHHFNSPTLNSNNRQEGQKVLEGCESVLEDLDSLIEKYNSLSPVKKVQLGIIEDIPTLRARLISNTGFLNSFIQRYDISTITIEYIMLISLISTSVVRCVRCVRCKHG